MNGVLSKGFNFKRNVSLLNQSASLGFEVSGAPPDVLAAITSDVKPFPARDIDLLEVGLTGSTAKPIEFGRGTDKVSFSATASAFAGLGVYRTGGALLKRLGEGAQDFSLDALEFGVDTDTLLGVLRWGFAADAKGSGAVALGAIGSATVDIAGTGEGLFAVIRRLPVATAARSVVQSLADSWIVPRQIASVDQLDPGTWIIAEVAGSISIGLGAQVGYDFNWVREAQLGGLTGDIGLRLQMGINAAVGFSTGGRCAVVVSRDGDAMALRLRVFRLKTKELDVSFNASVGIQLTPDTLLPGQIDDFIAAVFDVHGQQILSDLKILEKWTDRNVKLSDLLAEAGIDGAETLIARLAGVSRETLQQEFDAVHATAVSFIERWHALPHGVSSTILKLVQEQIDLATVRDMAIRLSTITPTELGSLLDNELNRIDFFHTPVGRLLESIGENGVLSLIRQPLADVQTVAKQVVGVLDGSTLEGVLRNFQSFVEKELGLDVVLATATDTDFAALDALLKKKLANFLGKPALSLQDVETVRTAIGRLLEKRDEYYEKALEALHRKYNVALTAASQSTTTDQALLDATFDFSHDPAAVQGFLQQALQGKLDDLLAIQPAQVSIAAGSLTHGITRQTHVDVSLPFMDITQSHLNESLASVDAVAHGGGLLFKVKASDVVTSSNRRKGVLSLAMGFSKSRDVGVRVHQDRLEMNYSLLFARRNMKIEHVRAQVGPALETIFKAKVGSVENFLSALDRQTEAVIPNGPNLLGNGLIAMDVSVSAHAAAVIGRAWLSLPVDPKADAYSNLSTAIQSSLKQNIHDSIFNGPDGYTNAGPKRAQVFLAYCALVPRAQKGSGWFWNWPDVDERRAMLNHAGTRKRMRTFLEHAQAVLAGDANAKHFKPEDTVVLLAGVDERDPFLNTLLAAESGIVTDALKGGVAIAGARVNASPSQAVKALASFGSKLTEAFNADITTLLGPGIQSLGTRVFLDASRAITTETIAETSAILNVEFVKPTVKFDDAALLAAGRVAQDELAVAARVVQIANRLG